MLKGQRANIWKPSLGILYLLLACAPSQVSYMKLDLGVGYNLSYRIIFWNQESPETTKLRMVVNVSEVSDLDYSLTATVSGDEEGTIVIQVSPGGKTMEAEVRGLPDPWGNIAAAGIVSPCVPLPQEPVSQGQSWEANLTNGKGVYTYKGKGFLEGKQGYILEFNVSTRGIRGIQAAGKLAVSPETGLIQAGVGTITTGFGTYGCRMIRE